jgi:hypothetical protein
VNSSAWSLSGEAKRRRTNVLAKKNTTDCGFVYRKKRFYSLGVLFVSNASMKKHASDLEKRMQEIDVELQKLRSAFRDIKVRSKTAVGGGLQRRDQKKIEEIRKKLGLG